MAGAISVIILFGIFILYKITNMPLTEDEKIEGKDAFDTILSQHHVPERHALAVVYYSRKYRIKNMPVVIWKEQDYVIFLIMNDNPYILKSHINKFKYITNYIQIQSTQHIEPYLSKAPRYIKYRFEQYTNFVHDDNPGDVVSCDEFNFYKNSMHSLLLMLGMPQDFFVCTATNSRWLLSCLPKATPIDNIDNEIQKLINSDLDYVEIQNHLYKMVENDQITNDKAISVLQSLK